MSFFAILLRNCNASTRSQEIKRRATTRRRNFFLTPSTIKYKCQTVFSAHKLHHRHLSFPAHFDSQFSVSVHLHVQNFILYLHFFISWMSSMLRFFCSSRRVECFWCINHLFPSDVSIYTQVSSEQISLRGKHTKQVQIITTGNSVKYT